MHTRAPDANKLRPAARKSALVFVTAGFAVCATVGLVACGGSGSGEVVAQVGGNAITRSAVSHWMLTLGGGDYYELSGRHVFPPGLVSDPPNYSACVSHLQAAAAGNPRASARLTPTNLLTKCRQINLALKVQATSYLLQAQQLIAAFRDEGITANENETQQLLNKIKAEQYPTQAALQQYLTSKHQTLADLRLVILLDVLRQKQASRVLAQGKQAIYRFVADERRWIARTKCSAGYVVQNCAQFKGEQTYPGGLSPAILMERVAALVTGRCTNLAACGEP